MEWYRAHASYLDLMDDVEALFIAVGLAASVERMSVHEAFMRYAQCDIFVTVSDPFDRNPDPNMLKSQAQRQGIFCGENDRWEDIFFRIFLEKIEPIGQSVPAFVRLRHLWRLIAAIQKIRRCASVWSVQRLGHELLVSEDMSSVSVLCTIWMLRNVFTGSLSVRRGFLQAVSVLRPVRG